MRGRGVSRGYDYNTRFRGSKEIIMLRLKLFPFSIFHFTFVICYCRSNSLAL
jgi:hypothetical protein